jgi:NAD(P)-dependent dehydrogenase (short-subunit alcohol dehydrogenase family)
LIAFFGRKVTGLNSFQGKSVVVTGGASGIGLACARAFSREGASVALWDIQEEAGKAAVREICSQGGTAEFFLCDMTEEAQIGEAASRTCRAFGRMDVLVGNAGIAERKTMLEDMDMNDFRRVINVNLTGVVMSNKYAVKYMMQNPGPVRGSVVNVASILGMVGAPMSTAYPAAKAAVINFTRAQAVTYGPLGIRFNSISPGYVNTPLLKNLPEELIHSRVALHPMGRFAEPAEIAEAVLFLAGPSASFITGSNLAADGGYTAQ